MFAVPSSPRANILQDTSRFGIHSDSATIQSPLGSLQLPFHTQTCLSITSLTSWD